MVIDPNGKLFEERRKKDRRKNDTKDIKEERRKNKDRRDPKNGYKV